MCINRQRLRQAGVSLVELIVAIVIIGVCVAGVLSVYTQAVRGSADPMIDKQALAIAEALLEEVQLAPFTFCDPADPAAETAANVGDCTIALQAGARPFDHVLKYNGLALNPASAMDGFVPAAGYSASVAVVAAALNGVGGGDAVQIIVTVTAPNAAVYTLEGWRTRYATNAVP